MSKLTVDDLEVSLRSGGDEIYARVWSDDRLTIDLVDAGEHAALNASPEDAYRFGLHLMGLARKAGYPK